MTPRQFADLAVALARHFEELSSGSRPDAAALHRVWQGISGYFRTWRTEIIGEPTPHLYAEFFAAELPIRIWCTAVSATKRREPDGAGPRLAAKIFTDLLELRCTALQALAADHGLTTAEAASLDRFRRRCERWADVLLGPISRRTGVNDFTLCPERAADFAEGASADPDGVASWPLVTAGVRLSFEAADEFRNTMSAPTADAAAELSAVLLASCPAMAFLPEGRFRAPAIGRAARIVDERVLRLDRRPLRQVPPPIDEQLETELPRAPHSISFASLRKRPPKN